MGNAVSNGCIVISNVPSSQDCLKGEFVRQIGNLLGGDIKVH